MADQDFRIDQLILRVSLLESQLKSQVSFFEAEISRVKEDLELAMAERDARLVRQHRVGAKRKRMDGVDEKQNISEPEEVENDGNTAAAADPTIIDQWLLDEPGDSAASANSDEEKDDYEDDDENNRTTATNPTNNDESLLGEIGVGKGDDVALAHSERNTTTARPGVYQTCVLIDPSAGGNGIGRAANKKCSFAGMAVSRNGKEYPTYHCKVDGCTKLRTLKGGVCWAHGRPKTPNKPKEQNRCELYAGTVISRNGKERPTYRCRIEGCTKLRAVKGGTCWEHGPPRPICTAEGCTNQTYRQGLCERHSGKKRSQICTVDGCENRVYKLGLCSRHVPKPSCGVEGCTNQSYAKTGVCRKHGGSVCRERGCTRPAKRGGICSVHDDRQCSAEGCEERGNSSGLCRVHLNLRKPRCRHDGCDNYAVVGGVCVRHGAQVKKRLCGVVGCEKRAQCNKLGFCRRHYTETEGRDADVGS